MRPVLEIEFKELKNTSVRMRALVKRTLGTDSNSRTSFHDMGVEGLDWDSFLEEYFNEFGVELEGLEYEDYFTEGVPISFSDIILFPNRLVRAIATLIFGRHTKVDKRKILTTGDLILSVHAGRFVKRENVEVRLKTYGLQQNV
jgi:hypothetical protein